MSAVVEFRTVDELGAELWPTWTDARRRKWIYRQVEQRGMPAMRLGRQLVFEVSAVTAWFDEQRCGDVPSALETASDLSK